MSVSMALFDYVPVTLFMIACIILQRDLYHMMSKGAFALFSCGTIMIFIGGVYKATWKLLYALGICDFQQLSACLMPMQGTGFIIAGIALVALLAARQENEKEKLYSAAPAVFSGTMIFACLDCIGAIAMGAVLSIIAAKMKKKGVIVLFVTFSIGLMLMGYLSSRDFTLPILNWMAEFVNMIAQGALLAGVIILHKSGLGEFHLK